MAAKQYSPRRALVTGGAGFIGSNLVRLLLAEGVDVRVMVQPGDPARNLADIRHRIEIVDGDLLSARDLDAALDGVDTLFHLAAIYAIWLRVPRRMFDVNVDGTRNIMQAARRAGVQRIVHTSSIAAVGSAGHGASSTEDDQFNEWDVASDYVTSKYVSELEVHRMVAEGLPAVIVNPAFPFGWGDIGPTPTGKTIEMLLAGFPFYFDGGFNGVGVADVAHGHWLAALHGQVGRRYVLGGENVTYESFGRKVARIAGVRAPTIKLSRNAMLAFGQLGDWFADHVSHTAPIASRRTIAYTAGRTLYFDISRARTELGYEPAPLDQHIEEAVAWFRRRTQPSAPPAAEPVRLRRVV